MNSHKYVINMPNITLSIPDDLHERLKNHPEIRWSEVARQAIHQYLDQIELLDKLTSKSQLTESDVQELSEIINSKVLDKLNKLFPD